MVELFLFLSMLLTVSIIADGARRMGRNMVFHGFAIYLVFHTFVFIIRPFLSYEFNFNSAWRYIGIWPTDEDYVFNLSLAMLGLLSMYIGVIAGLAKGKISKIKVIGSGSRLKWTATRNEIYALYLVGAVLLPIGLWSLMSASQTHEAMIMDPKTKIRIFTEGTGYFYELYNVIGPIVFLYAFLNRMRGISLIPLLLYLAFRVELGWGRFGFVLLIMSMMLFWIYMKGVNWRIILGAPATLVLFQFAGRMRDTNLSVDWYQKLDTLDFANFEYLTFVTRVVPDLTSTYTYFTQYLQLFTEPIPRALWPGKPIGMPIEMFNLLDYGNFISLTVSIIGDGWMSLGAFGVIIMTFATGYGLSKAFNWFLAHRYEKLAVLLYIVALPASVQWFRDGGISIVKFLFFLLVPIFFWLLTVRLINGAVRTRVLRQSPAPPRG